ncbi:hypothetical protein [Pseudomonas sp.]|uniref:hypothetical protein n=1 Tax=Pseudomonas sp. TaxID=306 RepID=UPI003FD72638
MIARRPYNVVVVVVVVVVNKLAKIVWALLVKAPNIGPNSLRHAPKGIEKNL